MKAVCRSQLLLTFLGGLLIISPCAAANNSDSNSAAPRSVVVTDGSVKLNITRGSSVIVTRTLIPLTSSDNGTLVVSAAGSRCNGVPIIWAYGYQNGTSSFGSYTPATLTGGDTVAQVIDTATSTCFGTAFSELQVSGFTSDPGASWLSSITCNGVKNTGASGSFTYVSSVGYAAWSWSTLFGFSGKVTKSVSCTIVHN